MLSNIKDIPALFECDEKNHKNFDKNAKNVLKIDVKKINQNDLKFHTRKYEYIMKQSKEDKKSYIHTGVLANLGLTINKSINFEKYRPINIADNVEEMKTLSDQLILENEKI